MKQILPIKHFYAGRSPGERTGPLGSFLDGKRLDIFASPDKASILPAPSKVSGSTVVDLIKWMLPVGTNVYHYGDAGKFYSCNNAGASWALIGTLTTASGNGMGYFKTDDFIYLPKDKTIAKYGPIGGTPTLTQDCFADGTIDLDQSNDASGVEDYSLATSISEGATHRQTFVPTKDPIRTIEVLVNDKGNGDWTLTVHDSANNVLGTKTLTNANIVSSGDQKFTFASDLRPIIGATYHFHLTSTIADCITGGGTNEDLEDVDYHEYFGILINDADYHPVAKILGKLVIGNERYLATWDGVTYDPNAIELPDGLKVRTLVRGKEFVVAGTWSGAAITDNDEGFLFFWDGTSPSLNFFAELGFGGVNSATVIGGNTFLIAGSTSALYKCIGVDEPEDPELTIPGIGDGKYIEVYPGAMDIWDGLLHIGIAGGGDSSSVLRGVWQYGRKDARYPKALNYAYTISNNDDEQDTDVTIGSIKGVGRRLFIGWKDGSTHGVDMVATTDNPAATAEYGSLIFDDNRPFKKKKVLLLVANHEALSGGAEGVKLRYKLDRASEWTEGSVNKAADAKITEFPVSLTDRWFELEVGFVLSGSGANKSKVTSISTEYDDLIEEKKVGK